MAECILSVLAAIRVFFRGRGDSALAILALRQQVAVLRRKRPRPTVNYLDRLFWTTLRRVWSRWSDVLVIVNPRLLSAGTAPAFALLAMAFPTAWWQAEDHR